MTTFTDTWNATFESLPPDTGEAALIGASRIRRLKLAIREREAVDHSIAGDAHDGKHKQVTLRVAAGDPTLDTGDGSLYTKAVSGVNEVFFKDSAGSVLQLTRAGRLAPFADATAPTKRVKFDTTSVTAGQERELKVPDNNIELANWSTGDVKLTLKTVADTGWVLFNDGTIGNAASGATTRANADTVALFTLLWNNTADAQCAVSGGRGASAAADYAANKTIALPKALGRALAVYGTGAGLSARVLAQIVGTETHVLSLGELPAHDHGSVGAHTHAAIGNNSPGGALTRFDAAVFTLNNLIAGDASFSGPIAADGGHTHASVGSGAAHQNMPPTLFLNVMVKL